MAPNISPLRLRQSKQIENGLLWLLPHTTDIVRKGQFHCRGQGASGEMATQPKLTGIDFDTFVNFELRPGAGGHTVLV